MFRALRSRSPLRALAALALLAVATSSPVFSQDGEADDEARWTPEFSMQFLAVQGTALSPDASRVAYVVREPRMEGQESSYRSHIWVAATDGSWNRQFTFGENSASGPRFSPDGSWMAFTTTRESDEDNADRSQVWILPMSGGESRPVTDAAAGVGSFRWSPDGSRIAFLMRDPETAEERTRREEKRDVILVDQNFKYSHLYVVEVEPDGDEIPDALRLTGGDFHVTGYDWSPDGTEIVFAHQPDPRINTGRLAGDISIVTVPSGEEARRILEREAAAEDETSDEDEGAESGDDEAGGQDAVPAHGEIRPLIDGPGVEGSPRWSPDGRWIAYAGTGDQPEPIGLGDLHVVSADGGQPRVIDTPNRSASILAWTDDSSALLLVEWMGTTRHVLSVAVEDGAITELSSGDGVIGSVSLDGDGSHMAFTWQTPDQPWDVFLSSTADYAPERVTDLHADIELPRMGRTELLSWTTDDGFEIEGLLTYPVGYQAGTRVPLILNVHGGPAGVYSQSFTGGPGIYMLQYFADQGFAILRPNPRGSTGYGKDFRFANFQDWGYGDFEDLMAGVDHVIEMGVADPDQLLLMGWSYGGYMTSWAVTQTDRFKAASMGAGLPNLVSMTTTTDIGDYLVGHMGVEFWEDYERYERHSAIYHIANVTTPTQVIHGANDLRVPFTQGQEFYRALDRRGVPTEMIVYPRTPHGPSEPKFLMDVSERILTWFRKHMEPSTVTEQ